MFQRVKIYVSTLYAYVPKHTSSALEDENPGKGRYKWQAKGKGKGTGKKGLPPVRKHK